MCTACPLYISLLFMLVSLVRHVQMFSTHGSCESMSVMTFNVVGESRIKAYQFHAVIWSTHLNQTLHLRTYINRGVPLCCDRFSRLHKLYCTRLGRKRLYKRVNVMSFEIRFTWAGHTLDNTKSVDFYRSRVSITDQS